MMSEDDCIGGGNALQTMAISGIEELGHHFVGNVAQTSRRTSAPAPAPAPAPAEGFNDWGGRGYDDFVPVEVTKTAPSGDETT